MQDVDATALFGIVTFLGKGNIGNLLPVPLNLSLLAERSAAKRESDASLLEPLLQLTTRDLPLLVSPEVLLPAVKPVRWSGDVSLDVEMEA
mmetsp:Transcript_20080/g.43697  ORF Transcript_20080/g.43697 Transcript_20080/m.43697 type:complete len:91 (+) Transcript_20080:231-503(+)